jgi:UDP-N-acetylglucosamine acyltransferase
MTEIHPTALVDPAAALSEDVTIGPYCVVGPGVELGAGVRLDSHVVVVGRTTLGDGCRVFPFACLGHRPQDLKYRGEDTRLVIGRNNQIREHVTMHPGTAGGGGVTRVGDDGLYMAGIHVAHDCRVGNGVIMANDATLGGHVEVQDHAYLGGLCAVHQFVRIGRQAMIGGLAGVEQDVIPYGMVLDQLAAEATISAKIMDL